MTDAEHNPSRAARDRRKKISKLVERLSRTEVPCSWVYWHEYKVCFNWKGVTKAMEKAEKLNVLFICFHWEGLPSGFPKPTSRICRIKPYPTVQEERHLKYLIQLATNPQNQTGCTWGAALYHLEQGEVSNDQTKGNTTPIFEKKVLGSTLRAISAPWQGY